MNKDKKIIEVLQTLYDKNGYICIVGKRKRYRTQ